MNNLFKRLLELVDDNTDGKYTVFAKKAGISHSTFQNYIKGRMPRADHILRIHNIFNVNINWLLTGKGEKYIKVGEGDREIGPIYNKVGNGDLKGELAGLDEFGAAVAGLKEIFDSRDPVLLPAIQANIRAFQISARRERQNHEQRQEIQRQSDKISTLEKECEDLKARLSALEDLIRKTPAAGGI